MSLRATPFPSPQISVQVSLVVAPQNPSNFGLQNQTLHEKHLVFQVIYLENRKITPNRPIEIPSDVWNTPLTSLKLKLKEMKKSFNSILTNITTQAIWMEIDIKDISAIVA